MSNYLSPKRRYVAMRQEIVEAAQQIMQQDGTDGLSMRSIARRVKTSPANLYEYFLNKEEIIFSVYNEVLHSLCAHLHQLKPTNDARTNLFNLANEYVHFIIQDPTQIQIVSHALQAEKLIQRTDEPSDRRQPTAPPSCRSAPHDRQAAQERTGNSPKSIAPDAMTTFYRENVQSIYDLFLGAIERCVAEGVIQRDTSMTT
ncbi:MAG: TetR/AcrR family transcriptional regulator, partial [Caldilineaceae bacterium]|nr:TetR/AcrR family transcriptional regulator [Caldilineaceae bacterium]